MSICHARPRSPRDRTPESGRAPTSLSRLVSTVFHRVLEEVGFLRQTGVAPSFLINASPSALVITAHEDVVEVSGSSLRNIENFSSSTRKWRASMVKSSTK
jgi:hypothetical protein